MTESTQPGRVRVRLARKEVEKKESIWHRTLNEVRIGDITLRIKRGNRAFPYKPRVDSGGFARPNALDIFRKARSSRVSTPHANDHRQNQLKHPAGSLFIAHLLMVIFHMFQVKTIGSRAVGGRHSAARAIGQSSPCRSLHSFTRGICIRKKRISGEDRQRQSQSIYCLGLQSSDRTLGLTRCLYGQEARAIPVNSDFNMPISLWKSIYFYTLPTKYETMTLLT